MKSTKVLSNFLVFAALILLLGLTFLLAHINLGFFNTPIAIIIAPIKAILVGIFFMNLRFSHGIHRVFAISGLFILGILFFLALADFRSRGWLPLPGSFPPPTQEPL